jgi:hypothetical protein
VDSVEVTEIEKEMKDIIEKDQVEWATQELSLEELPEVEEVTEELLALTTTEADSSIQPKLLLLLIFRVYDNWLSLIMNMTINRVSLIL